MALRRTRPATRLVDGGRSHRFSTLPARAWAAAAVVLLLLAAAAFGPWLTPYAVNQIHAGPPAAPPSGDHLMGTDQFGRDLLSRVIAGTRVSVVVGFFAVALALAAAAIVGAIAATSRRWINESIMRVLDVIMAFPGVIIAVGLAAVVRPSLATIVGVVAVLYMPRLSRVVRANVLAQYGEDYVEAAKAVGNKRKRILARHVAVNCVAPVLVFAATMVADAIVLEASLSFLGLGVQPPDPSWGNILADGRQLVFSGGWWVSVFPGAAIFVSVLALNVVAEGVADGLAAPKKSIDQTPSDTEAGTRQAKFENGSAPIAYFESRDRDDLLSDPGRGTLLHVDRLCISFPEVYGAVDVVSDVSFGMHEGEVVAMAGESGCGKSLVGLALMGLLPPQARAHGRVALQGQDLLTLPPRERRKLLGSDIAMIYQDALSALNPGMTAGRQLAQVCRLGSRYTSADLLDLVGLPKNALRAYPNQLSGGQRQRVLIAMALARSPRLLIADEPTTALDETIQAQVTELLTDLQRELGFSVLLSTHNLALASDVARRLLVFYAGQLVEAGTTDRVISSPRHPYTAGLLRSIRAIEGQATRLAHIPGAVPSPGGFSAGCRFVDRCDRSQPGCAQAPPALEQVTSAQFVACPFPVAHDPTTVDERG